MNTKDYVIIGLQVCECDILFLGWDSDEVEKSFCYQIAIDMLMTGCNPLI